MFKKFFSRKFLGGIVGGLLAAYLHSKGKHEAAYAVEFLFGGSVAAQTVVDTAEKLANRPAPAPVPPKTEK